MSSTPSLLRAKFKALAAHLSISTLLVALAFALILLRWFPAPLFVTDDAGDGLKLLVLVDMVLGPLLTFVVFNPAKTERAIRFDLGTIALAQLAAFTAGLVSIHSVRIQAVAFDGQGSFQTVTAKVFKDQTIEQKDWLALGVHEPYFVTAREPATAEEQAGVMSYGLMAGRSPYQLQFLYEPVKGQLATVDWAAYRSAEILRAAAPLAETAARWMHKHGILNPERLRFFPVAGYSRSAVLVFNDAGEWLGGFAGKLASKVNPHPAAQAPAPTPASGKTSQPLAPPADKPKIAPVPEQTTSPSLG